MHLSAWHSKNGQDVKKSQSSLVQTLFSKCVQDFQLHDTHRARKIAVELLNNGRKTSACLVQELPASAHGFAVPARRGVLFQGLNVTFLFMIEMKLKKNSKFERMENEESEPPAKTHCHENVQ